MYDISLDVPQRRRSGKISYTDPKFLKEWTESLIQSSTGESAKRLFQALRTVNEHEVELDKRINFLSVISKPLRTVLAEIDPRFQRIPLPLNDMDFQIAMLSGRLNSEMAVGYRLCLLAMSHASWLEKRSNRQRHAYTSQRFLYYANGILMNARYLNEPLRAGFWDTVHTVFAQAEIEGVHQDAVRDPRTGHTTSVEREFKRTLLFQLLEPRRISLDEIGIFEKFMEEAVDMVELSQNWPKGNAKQHHFCVQLDEDMPPSRFKAACGHVCNAGPQRRVLDAEKLVKSLVAGVARHHSFVATPAGNRLPKPMALTLLQAWGSLPSERGRVEEDTASLAFLGLSNISSALLVSDKDKERSFGSESLRVDIASHAHGTLTIWEDYLASRKNNRDVMEVFRQKYRLNAKPARVLNRSSDGFCIAIDRVPSETLQFGELVYIEIPGEPKRVGMVRWVKSEGFDGVIFGVWNILRDVTPMPLFLNKEGDTPIPALFGADKARHPILVVPRMPLNRDVTITLHNNDGNVPMAVTDKVIASPIFEGYRIRPQSVEEAAKNAGRQAAKQAKAAKDAHSEFGQWKPMVGPSGAGEIVVEEIEGNVDDFKELWKTL